MARAAHRCRLRPRRHGPGPLLEGVPAVTLIGPAVSPCAGRGVSAPPAVPRAGMLALLEARADLVTLDGAAVDAWTGQAGTGNDNAVKANDATRPTWIASEPTLNGEPAVWFSASNSNRLILPSLNPSLPDCHMVVVCNVLSLGAFPACFLRQDVPLNCIGAARTDVGSVGGHDGTAWRSVAAATTGPQLLEFVWRSGALTLEVLRDGVSLGTAAYDGTLSLVGSTTLAVLADARVGWLSLHNRALADAEAARYRGYLFGRYGI